ncbi:hypothetical protein, partial [Thiolapillus sp.]
MTRTAGAPIGCQRPSRFWGLGCPKIYHEAEDTLAVNLYAPHAPSPTMSASAQVVTIGGTSHAHLICWLFDVSYGFQYGTRRAGNHVDHSYKSSVVSIASGSCSG